MPLFGFTLSDHTIRNHRGHAVGADQGRVRADLLVAEHLAKNIRTRIAELVGHDGQVGEVRRIDSWILHQLEAGGHLAVAGGNHQRVILHDVVGLRGDGVDVDRARDDGDRVVRAQLGREVDVLDVINQVKIRQSVRIPLDVEVRAGLDVVAEIHQRIGRVIEVGDHEIQIVHELDAGGGIAGRIGPDQRQSHRLILSGVGHLNFDRAAVAGGERVGRALIKHQHGQGGTDGRTDDGGLIGERRRNAVRQVDQTPALIVDRVLHLEVIPAADRARAVDHQRLHQRRAVRDLLQLEKFLHQRQHPGHGGRRHARAGFVAVKCLPIRATQRVVEVAQHLKIISLVVRRHDRGLQVERDGKIRGIADAEKIDRARRQRGVRRQGNDVVAQHVKTVGGGHVVQFHINRQVDRRRRGRDLDGQLHRVVRDKNRRKTRQPVGRHPLMQIGRDGVVGGVVIGQLIPLLRPRRNHKRPRRDHVRLEPSEVPLDADADVPARGEGRHLVAAVRLAQPRCADVRASGGDLHHLVGDPARLLDGSDGDDVLGRGRRHDALRTAVQSVVVATAGVARREHEQDRLRAGPFRQRVPHRRVVTRRGDVIPLIGVAPTVVGDQGVRLRRRLLQLKIAERIADRHDE